MTDISSTLGTDMAALHMGNQRRSADDTIAALARAANGPNGFDVEAARATAEDFESTFIASLVDTMFSGLDTDGPFGGGQSESMFRSMLNQEYGKVMSANGGIGLADNVLDSIIRLQTNGQMGISDFEGARAAPAPRPEAGLSPEAASRPQATLRPVVNEGE